MNLIINNPYRTLGLLVGSSAAQQNRQLSRLKMYIEAEQEPEQDFSFPSLGINKRSIEIIEYAASKLNLDADKMLYSLFWFYNGNPITDEPAFDALKEAFKNKINFFKNGMDSIAALYPNANESMLKQSNTQNNTFFDKLLDNYDQMHARILQQRETEKRLKKGNKAPNFSNYENYNGNTSSLLDFRGKYVYIDVWATWCGPCRALAPVINEVKNQFSNVKFEEYDVDTAYDEATKYGIRSVPTIIIEKNGVEVDRFTGASSKLTYINALNEHLK